jgi:hypothetical protein
MDKWAYAMSNVELLNEFCRYYAKAAVSNSGLVISCFGSYEADEANYFKGVLLARLDGVKPPFKRGDVVSPKTNNDVHSVGWRDRQKLSGDATQTISRIYYEGSGCWLLMFHGAEWGEGGYPKYDSSEFKLHAPVAEESVAKAANG